MQQNNIKEMKSKEFPLSNQNLILIAGIGMTIGILFGTGII
ncbi:hypothetical protein [Lentibacillus jeotgali]|nr:hypothetical protein [Lentibacillus jeotgali]